MIRALVLAVTLAAAFPVVAQVRDWRDASTAAVTQSAKRGDKLAALELGKRYEGGRGGLPCDAGRAQHWYKRAARTTGSRRYAYSSAVGKENYGRMIEVDGGAVSLGLPEAGERLAALRLAGRSGQRRDCRDTASNTAIPSRPAAVEAKGDHSYRSAVRRTIAQFEQRSSGYHELCAVSRRSRAAATNRTALLDLLMAHQNKSAFPRVKGSKVRNMLLDANCLLV